MRNRWLHIFGVMGLAFFAGVPSAYAVCTNPDGVAGKIVFNQDHQIMQYCDDTNWRSMGPPEPCADPAVTAGTRCRNGMVYAGHSPDENVPMYTTPNDAPNRMSWNNGTGNYSDTAMEDCTNPSPGTATTCRTGVANTALLVGATAATDYPFEAAEYCNGLSAHGFDDWYLPAQDELNVLFINKNAGALNGTFDDDDESSFPIAFYWSSSEHNSSNGRRQRFWGNSQGGNGKSFNLSVRCVRKDGPKLTSIVPDGLVGHWKLDEDDFPYVDSSPTGVNATVSGGTDPVSVPARLSDGLDFLDDRDRRISTATSATYAGLSTFTISAWIKSDDVEGGNYSGIVDIDGIGGLYIGFNNNRLGLRANGWDTQNGNWGVNDRLVSGQWHHVAVTYDTAAPSGTKPTIYIDGVGDGDPSTAFTGTGSFINPASSIVTIGAVNISSSWRGFNGEIDDVRIYDRILSANEIHYLYQSFDKHIKYDTDVRVPKYFNGDDWVAMGESKYVPNAVVFDGTNDNLQSSTLTNSSDSKRGTVSVWVKPNSLATNQKIHANTSYMMNIQVWTSGRVSFFGKEPDGASIILNMDSNSGLFDPGSWHHILASWDMSDPNKRNIYINGADEFNAAATYIDDLIDYTQGVAIGSDTVGNDKVDGSIADLWFSYGSYIDLSVEANRRKFIDENGDPVYLGADGGIPTGSAPDIFLSGDTDNWHTNKGTGGGFTENGALTDAITKPGGPFLPTDGLVGYWKMDEVSGTSVIDYASANNGTYRDSDGAVANVRSQSGVHGSALDFTDHKVALGTPADLDFSSTNAFSISAWVKPSENGGISIFHRGTGFNSNMSYYFGRYNLEPSRWRITIFDGTSFPSLFTTAGTVRTGVWVLMTAT